MPSRNPGDRGAFDGEGYRDQSLVALGRLGPATYELVYRGGSSDEASPERGVFAPDDTETIIN